MRNNKNESGRGELFAGLIPLAVMGVIVGSLALHIKYSGRESLEYIAEHERSVIVEPVSVDSNRYVVRASDGSELKCKPDYHFEGSDDYSSVVKSLQNASSGAEKSSVELRGYDGRLVGCEDNRGFFMVTSARFLDKPSSIN